ncbi:uncharacterized protein ACR2FA_009192 [Aphomia sociella]
MAHLELKTDTPIVSTKLAEEYLAKYKNDIADIRNNTLSLKKIEINIVQAKQKLAKKIAENADLFCQLEYLIRNKSIDDVKNIDLKLLGSSLLDNFKIKFESVALCDNSPLAVLGQMCFDKNETTVFCTDKTVAVSHLFSNLCYEIGLTNVVLRNLNRPEKDVLDKFTCAGVVTEKSDIDSAIDAFLTSTSQYPWRLRQILVQESVFDSFKKAVEFKSKLSKHDDVDVPEDLRRLSTESHVYKDKIFLYDYVGGDVVVIDDRAHRVRVEAYRTTKELLSLIQNVTVLSLWSSDISEAHEISIEAPSILIWINDFGNVEGPPMSSRWLPSHLSIDIQDEIKKLKSNAVELLLKSLKSWSRIDAKEKRLYTVNKGLEKYKSDASSDRDLITSIEYDLLSYKGHNSVEIENGRLYMNFDVPVGVMTSCIKKSDHVIDLIRSLLIGNVHLVLEVEPQYVTLLSKLQEAGVPVTVSRTELSKITRYPYFYKSKTVISNFGTIFAN